MGSYTPLMAIPEPARFGDGAIIILIREYL